MPADSGDMVLADCHVHTHAMYTPCTHATYTRCPRGRASASETPGDEAGHSWFKGSFENHLPAALRPSQLRTVRKV